MKIIKVMLDETNVIVVSEDPFKEISDGHKYERRQVQTKRQGQIYEEIIFPTHSEKKMVLKVDRYNMISILNVKFCHQGSKSKIHYPINDIIHSHTLYSKRPPLNTVVDTAPGGLERLSIRHHFPG